MQRELKKVCDIIQSSALSALILLTALKPEP
jgi:hypothetical protein